MTDDRPVRQPSAVDRVAEDWVTTLVRRSAAAVRRGPPG
ncbi:hypothetical protein CURTO8I2_290089 [Curtobacterium sp. 8I-2]|nr:hypothetical protein CURTO8I2_290089 [Curtobacterium sp. 8I-2]